MASVTCDRCGSDIPVSAFRCPSCGAPRPRAGASRVEQPRAADTDGGTADPAPIDVARPDESPCDHLDNPPGRLICQRCNAPIPRRPAAASTEFVLMLPWGEHRLRPGEVLEIGREVGPYGSRLAQDTKVSRRHAMFTATESSLLVRDCGSSNGTRCNGATVSTSDFELRDGDRVELSSQLTIEVRRPTP